MPVQAGTAVDRVKYGAYLLNLESVASAQLIIAATGSELALAVQGAKLLGEKGIVASVVSMPCFELFEAQGKEYVFLDPLSSVTIFNSIATEPPGFCRYQLSVFKPGLPVLSVEASSIKGWEKYAHLSIGLDDCYGASGPYKAVLAKFGFTVENVVAQAETLLAFYEKAGPAPSKINVPTSSFVVAAGH